MDTHTPNQLDLRDLIKIHLEQNFVCTVSECCGIQSDHLMVQSTEVITLITLNSKGGYERGQNKQRGKVRCTISQRCRGDV